MVERAEVQRRDAALLVGRLNGCDHGAGDFGRLGKPLLSESPVLAPDFELLPLASNLLDAHQSSRPWSFVRR